MRKYYFTVVALLIATMASPLQGQSIAERLKKALKVSVTRPDSAARSDSNSRHSPGQSIARGPLPTSTTAHPDLLGIKVGLSTVNDVKAALSVPALGLVFEERDGRKIGKSKESGSMYTIPKSEYTAFVLAGTKPGSPYEVGTSCQNRIKCQDIVVDFAGPPNEPIAMAVRRQILFGESGPLSENIVNSLTEKYGQPFRSKYHELEIYLAWAWAADGSPVALSENHPYMRHGAQTSAYGIAQSKAALEDGCAAIVRAVIFQRNSVANSQQVFAIDHFAIYTTNVRSAAYVDDMVLKIEACKRDKAGKAGVATEFGDPAPGAKTAAPSADPKAASATASSQPKTEGDKTGSLC